MKLIKKKTDKEGVTRYEGRAAIIMHHEIEFIVVAADAVCLQRAITRITTDPEFKIDPSKNRNVVVTQK